MSLSKITLVPATPGDYLYIAKLVEECFMYEEFGIVAFGPKRLTLEGNEKRAKKMSDPAKPGQTKYEMKAVTILPDGTERIVGYAEWFTCVGRGGTEEEKERLGNKEGWPQEDKEMEERKNNPVDEEGHGNPKIRKDVFGGVGKALAKASEGKDYVILSLLVVDPEYQRRGIGAMLFEDGLRVADEAGLQVILGASERGIGLYKKYGCIQIGSLKTNLWEYEGGEGLGVSIQNFLRRPPVSSESVKTI